MVIVKLQGGLGNQMFQYAAARGFSGKQNILYDDQFFREFAHSNDYSTSRNYELNLFKNLILQKVSAYQQRFIHSQRKVFRLLKQIFPLFYIRQLHNEYIDFSKINFGSNIYLDGYFQSEKYFKHIRAAIIKEFTFPEFNAESKLICQSILSSPNTTSIHIRRGDYLNPAFDVHGILPLNYYYKALNKLQEKYTNLSVFIFSDDIAWVKSNFNHPDINPYYVNCNQQSDQWQDMALMTYCTHHIIANSSFSWWGAWLAKTSGDIFAPRLWFNPSKIQFNIHDFVPGSWTIVDVD